MNAVSTLFGQLAFNASLLMTGKEPALIRGSWFVHPKSGHFFLPVMEADRGINGLAYTPRMLVVPSDRFRPLTTVGTDVEGIAPLKTAAEAALAVRALNQYLIDHGCLDLSDKEARTKGYVPNSNHKGLAEKVWQLTAVTMRLRQQPGRIRTAAMASKLMA